MHPGQASFDDLGTPLHEVTFVVVDLETTGGSSESCEITEIGAVKVRGGEVLGEFQSLVRPRSPIPPFITVLTGIDDRMVAQAPRIEQVLPSFLDFAGDAVLVAHNAGFDIGFLKAAARHCDVPWPGNTVVDTVRLARAVVTRDEVPNHKLGTLAKVFGAETQPDHRALHDARATVDVLHGIIGRIGSLGAHSLEELCSFSSRVTPAQRRKRFLADDLPTSAGVYRFEDAQGRVLYVGTAVNIKRRVRSYFTASEGRRRMAEMVAIATKVVPIPCATVIEARVRELRLIAEHDPPYNRRSRRPERAPWVKLTDEPFPRLSVVRQVRDDGATYIGPFTSARSAQDAVAAVHESVPLRQCTQRIGPRSTAAACVLADIGRCGAPCVGRQTQAEYASVVDQARDVLTQAVPDAMAAIQERMTLLANQERYEEAGAVRDRMMALLRGAARTERLRPLAMSPELVAARRRSEGGWEMVCVRYGRLAGSSTSPPGADPMPYVRALCLQAEVVDAPIGPAPACSAEETEKVLGWLEEDGTRLVSLEGEWSCPAVGATRLHRELGSAEDLRQVDPFEQRRGRSGSSPAPVPAGLVSDASA